MMNYDSDLEYNSNHWSRKIGATRTVNECMFSWFLVPQSRIMNLTFQVWSKRNDQRHEEIYTHGFQANSTLSCGVGSASDVYSGWERFSNAKSLEPCAGSEMASWVPNFLVMWRLGDLDAIKSETRKTWTQLRAKTCKNTLVTTWALSLYHLVAITYSPW